MRIIYLLLLCSLLYGDIDVSNIQLKKAYNYLHKHQIQKAIEIYKNLSKDCIADADYNLGIIYYFIQKDNKLAFYYFQKASNTGLPEAKYYLAVLLSKKAKIKDDTIVKLIIESAVAGYPDAQEAFGKLLLDINKTDDAKQWFEKASKQGNVKAKEFLKRLKK